MVKLISNFVFMRAPLLSAPADARDGTGFLLRKALRPPTGKSDRGRPGFQTSRNIWQPSAPPAATIRESWAEAVLHDSHAPSTWSPERERQDCRHLRPAI